MFDNIIFDANLIPKNENKTLGKTNLKWESLYVSETITEKIKTNDISNNISVLSSLIPEGNRDISNIVQLDLGSTDNNWNSAHVNSMYINNLYSSTSDVSENIIVKGNLVPDGPYNNNVSGYSLGAPNKWWKDLHLSSGTIFIGGSSIGLREL